MIIFADSRDPIFNSRDPNRVPKTPLKNPGQNNFQDSKVLMSIPWRHSHMKFSDGYRNNYARDRSQLSTSLFINRCTWKSSQYCIIIIMLAPVMRVSYKLVFHRSECVSAIRRLLSTTAMYISSSSFTYLCIPCYCDACLKSSSSALRVGEKTLHNTTISLCFQLALRNYSATSGLCGGATADFALGAGNLRYATAFKPTVIFMLNPNAKSLAYSKHNANLAIT